MHVRVPLKVPLSTIAAWTIGLASAPAMVGGAALVAGERSIVIIAGARGNFCTGTALARDLVLTAAHCAAPASTYTVFPAKGAAPIATRGISVHPRYEPQSYANSRATADVALIRLATALPAGIVAAELNRAASPVAVGEQFVIAGFGTTAPNSDAGLGVPRTATLVVTGQPGVLQIRLYDPATKGERPGLGACTGDSGGPAFRDGRVAGVVSWSTGPKLTVGCGGLTGVTPLVRYHDWVVQAAGKLGSPLP